MARIEINDLEQDEEISQEELNAALGGFTPVRGGFGGFGGFNPDSSPIVSDFGQVMEHEHGGGSGGGGSCSTRSCR